MQKTFLQRNGKHEPTKGRTFKKVNLFYNKMDWLQLIAFGSYDEQMKAWKAYINNINGK